MYITHPPYSREVRSQAFRIMNHGGSAFDVHSALEVPLCTATDWLRDFKVNRFEVTPSRSLYSKEIRQKALFLFQQGKGYKAVASALALPVYTVRDWHRSFKNGRFIPQPRKQTSWPEPKSNEVREKVQMLADIGLSNYKISEITGVCVSTVRLWLKNKK